MLRIGAAAKKLGFHPQTLRRWIKEGRLVGVHMGKEVRIPRTEIERLLGEQTEGIVVLYAHVSAGRQKSDMATQRETLRQWAARERPTANVLTTAIPGVDSNQRKGLAQLIRQVQDQQIREVVVTYADRLTRFGFEYLRTWFAGYGTQIVVLAEEDSTSPEQELYDLLAIITSFSGRLYGMRSRKHQRLLGCVQHVVDEGA